MAGRITATTTGRRGHRLLRAVACATVTAAFVVSTSTAAGALTVNLSDTPMRIDSSSFGASDFGSGGHSFGRPDADGVVTWRANTTDHTYTAGVFGNVYYDDGSRGGCARVRLDFRSRTASLATRVTDIACRSGSGSVVSRPVAIEFSHALLYEVVFDMSSTFDASGQTGWASATFITTGPRPGAPTDKVKLLGVHGDIGSGAHLAGGPVDSALVTWSVDAATGIVAARLRGTVYWDFFSLGGCVRARVQFRDGGENVLKTKYSDRVCWTPVATGRAFDISWFSRNLRSVTVTLQYKSPLPESTFRNEVLQTVHP